MKRGTVTVQGGPPQFSVQNWAALRPGDNILLSRKPGTTEAGTVDDVSLDGDIIWLRQYAASTRRLIHATDFVEIRCSSEQFSVSRIAALMSIKQVP